MKKIKYLSPITEVIKIENTLLASESEQGVVHGGLAKKHTFNHENSSTPELPSSKDGVSGRDYSPWE